MDREEEEEYLQFVRNEDAKWDQQKASVNKEQELLSQHSPEFQAQQDRPGPDTLPALDPHDTGSPAATRSKMKRRRMLSRMTASDILKRDTDSLSDEEMIEREALYGQPFERPEAQRQALGLTTSSWSQFLDMDSFQQHAKAELTLQSEFRPSNSQMQDFGIINDEEMYNHLQRLRDDPGFFNETTAAVMRDLASAGFVQYDQTSGRYQPQCRFWSSIVVECMKNQEIHWNKASQPADSAPLLLSEHRNLPSIDDLMFSLCMLRLRHPADLKYNADLLQSSLQDMKKAFIASDREMQYEQHATAFMASWARHVQDSCFQPPKTIFEYDFWQAATDGYLDKLLRENTASNAQLPENQQISEADVLKQIGMEITKHLRDIFIQYAGDKIMAIRDPSTSKKNDVVHQIAYFDKGRWILCDLSKLATNASLGLSLFKENIFEPIVLCIFQRLDRADNQHSRTMRDILSGPKVAVGLMLGIASHAFL
jgi:hypothetical protein